MFNYEIPNPSDFEAVADWAEFYVLYTEESLSKAAISSHIEMSRGFEPSEDQISSIWNELEQRQNRYGASPPFECTSLLIEPKKNWRLIPEYMAFLIFALEGNPNTDNVSASDSGKLFERISQVAISKYINGECIIYGFPNQQTIAEISSDMGEQFNAEPPAYRKDRGVDLFAWKSFGDGRASQIILLIQCAAGHNWKSKLTELTIGAWKTYIGFAAEPVKGFSMPGILSNDSDLKEYSLDSGILFDRTRLYRNIVSETRDSGLVSDVVAWCDKRLTEILA